MQKDTLVGSLLSYWEVFKEGEDGDIFEVVQSPASKYVGLRVAMKQNSGYGIVMKKLGTRFNDSIDTLILPHGSITGSLFRKVEAYTELDGMEGLQAIKEGKEVFVKDKFGLVKTDMLTDLLEVGICDFDDLLSTKFYIKS